MEKILKLIFINSVTSTHGYEKCKMKYTPVRTMSHLTALFQCNCQVFIHQEPPESSREC